MDKKTNGQVMTPFPIIELILNTIGYTNKENILYKNILEPSFGDGAFLSAILSRIIAFAKKEKLSNNEIKNIIHKNVFGIEKDLNLYNITIDKLNKKLKEEKIISITEDFNWDNNLYNADTLYKFKDLLNNFDFIVGNPPYIRIHNLEKNTIKYIKENSRFNKKIIDIYISFYDISLKMLKKDIGKLCFITPNSFIKNTSQSSFREFIINNKYLSVLYDFKDSNVFDNADTYVCICLLSNNPLDTNNIQYKEYKNLNAVFSTSFTYTEFLNKYNNGKPWYFPSNTNFIYENNSIKKIKLKDIAIIQNGIVTNKDDIYIHNFVFTENGEYYLGKHTDKKQIVYLDNKKENGGIPIESTILHRCIKISTYHGKQDICCHIIFPYMSKLLPKYINSFTNKTIESNYTPISITSLKSNYPLAFNYLEMNYNILINRDIDKKDIQNKWFLFGRTQGLLNCGFKKIILRNIFDSSNKNSLMPYIIDEDVIVYSGFYTIIDIMNNDDNLISDVLSYKCFSINNKKYYQKLQEIYNIYISNDFFNYCKFVGKNKKNGYIAISTNQIKCFGIK